MSTCPTPDPRAVLLSEQWQLLEEQRRRARASRSAIASKTLERLDDKAHELRAALGATPRDEANARLRTVAAQTIGIIEALMHTRDAALKEES